MARVGLTPKPQVCAWCLFGDYIGYSEHGKYAWCVWVGGWVGGWVGRCVCMHAQD